MSSLFLNIYAPSNATNSSALPVKVWLYGGFNQAGGISDPTYNGCFAATDSIFVSVNYRLGPLGFLSLPTAGLAGNYGLQDQLLALQWIQENIASFGGDPRRVLLFGQSAGAADTLTLATLPLAPSLFSAAAVESGNRDFPTTQEAQPYNAMFARKLSCSLTDANCLRAASLTALNDTVLTMPSSPAPGVNSLLQNSGKGVAWGPVIDGVVVREQPTTAGVRVPTIFGSNANDGSLFVLSSYGLKAESISTAQYDVFLNDNFGAFASAVRQAYPLTKYPSGLATVAAVVTEFGFLCPIHRSLALATAKGVPVYAYQFNHTPSCAWYSNPAFANAGLRNLLGATHTAEIPFVLGLTENLPPPSGSCAFSPAEVAISEFMVSAWTSMAAIKRPGPDEQWPTWTANESQGIVIGEEAKVAKLDFSVCAFWDEIDANIMAADNNQTRTTTSASSGISSSTAKPNSTSLVRLEFTGLATIILMVLGGII